jgi:hypothetical protein
MLDSVDDITIVAEHLQTSIGTALPTSAAAACENAFMSTGDAV